MALVYTLVKILLRINSRLIAITGIMQLILEHHQVLSPMSQPVNWLDNQDVMQKLKISDSTLRRLRDQGTISYSRIGGKYYYNESDIQAVLSEGANKI